MGLLTLVRHGQASFLQADYDKLSSLGELQARKLGEYWVARGVRFDHVYYGPARRQTGTGEIVRQLCADAGIEWADPVCLTEFDEYPGIEVMRAFPRALEQLTETDLASAVSALDAETTAFLRAGGVARWRKSDRNRSSGIG